MNMYDASENLEIFSDKMIKIRARKYSINVTIAEAVLSRLLKVESYTTTNEVKFINHGTLIWFGAALQKTQRELRKASKL